jgi:anaerobic magnesium-protoporphyrin IX monomethyl ester cyclase
LDYIRIVNPTIATFNVMEPRPGTDVYRDPSKYGITIPNPYWYESTAWLTLPVCHTETLTQEEIRAWVHCCYNEFCGADFREPEKMAALQPVRAAWDTAAESVQRHLPLLLA